MCDTKDNQACSKARPLADCVKTCTESAATVPPKCLKYWDKWVATAAKDPWTCDPNKYPQTVSSNELTAFYTCVDPTSGADMSQYPKPKVPDCALSSFERNCDACLMLSCGEELLACGRNKECQAINRCIETCSPTAENDQKLACLNRCKSKHEGGRVPYEEMRTCTATCQSQCLHGGGYSAFGYYDEQDAYQVSTTLHECTGVFP